MIADSVILNGKKGMGRTTLSDDGLWRNAGWEKSREVASELGERWQQNQWLIETQGTKSIEVGDTNGQEMMQAAIDISSISR